MSEFQACSGPKFGITFFSKAEEQKNVFVSKNNAMENPLFSAKNFKMPKPGLDGNPFGGSYC